jgi:hypothetical protein
VVHSHSPAVILFGVRMTALRPLYHMSVPRRRGAGLRDPAPAVPPTC